MAEKDLVKSLFLIWTFESPEPSVLESMEGLEATLSDTWKIGDRIENSQLLRETYGFKIKGKFDETFDLEDCLRSFVEQHEAIVTRLIHSHPLLSAILSITEYGAERGGVYLDNSLLKRIVETGSHFDYDAYPK